MLIPKLFNIYINELQEKDTNTQLQAFADDLVFICDSMDS